MGPLITTRIREAADALWQWLRGASGEHAYECYARHAVRHGERLLSPQEFYLQSQQHKYRRPSRCC